MRCLLPLLLFSATAALAGLYDQPYSLIEVGQKSEVRDERPAALTRIDDKSTTRLREVVSPGKHSVVVGLPPAKGTSVTKQQTLEIDAKPCVRYKLAAKRSSRTAKDWEAFVQMEEPIGECTAKFFRDKPDK